MFCSCCAVLVLLSFLQHSVHLSLDEGNFDSQYVLQDASVLGVERRERMEQQKRDADKQRRRASKQLRAQAGSAAAPSDAAAPAAAAAAAAGAAVSARVASRPAPAGGSSRRDRPAPVGLVVLPGDVGPADDQEQHGESNTPPAKGHVGRFSSKAVASASEAGCGRLDPEASPGDEDSSGSRCA